MKVVLAMLSFALAHGACAAEFHWYKGNTHTHTINSDGDASPDTVVRWYREHGYHFLFITDHEYVTDPAPLNALFGASERFLILPGQEITQWGADPARSSAHVNSLFTTQVIWPMGKRTCAGGSCGATVDASVPLAVAFKTNIAAVIAANGIAQINHPNYRWSVKPEDLYAVPNGCLFEVWNGQGHINNLGGTDDEGDTRPSTEGFWDILLSRGKVIWGVGSDDSHNFGPTAEPHVADPGRAWIMVRAPELTHKAVEAALRRGDFYASTGITLDEIAVNHTTMRELKEPHHQPLSSNVEKGEEPSRPAHFPSNLSKLGKTEGARVSGKIEAPKAGDRFSFSIAEKIHGASRYLTRFIGRDGKVLAEVAGTHPTYRIKGAEQYVRASIIDSNGNRAWTQPVFLDGRSDSAAP